QTFGSQLTRSYVEAYEADKILLDTYGDTVTIKRPRDGADDDQEPSAGTDRGFQRRKVWKREPALPVLNQSAPVADAMQILDVFNRTATRSLEQVSKMTKQKKRSNIFLIGFKDLQDYLLRIMHGNKLFIARSLKLSNLGLSQSGSKDLDESFDELPILHLTSPLLC
ncbi:hypothetical protein Tco_0999424, partial [Tanacetum coccineum]